MVLFEKMVQNPGVVQRNLYRLMTLKHLDEGQIRFLISVLSHEVEIADRLMIMDGKDELHFRHLVETPCFSDIFDENTDWNISLPAVKCQPKTR
jgi:hypothetical protein